MIVWVAAAWAGVCGDSEPVGQLGELVEPRLVAVERDRTRQEVRPGMALCSGDRIRTWYGTEVVIFLYDGPPPVGEDSLYERSIVGRLRENADVEVFSCGFIQHGGLAGYAFPERSGCLGEVRLGTSGYYLTNPASQVVVDMGGDDDGSLTCLTAAPVVAVGAGWVPRGDAGHGITLVGPYGEQRITGGEVVEVGSQVAPVARTELLGAAAEDELLVATRQLDRRSRQEGLVVQVPDGETFGGVEVGGRRLRGFEEVAEGTWWLRSERVAEKLRAAGERLEVVTDQGRVEVQAGVGAVLVVPVEEPEPQPEPVEEPSAPPVVARREATPQRPAMVRIEAGRFMMGSPPDEAGRDPDETQHEVLIPRPFELSTTEVTQAQYVAVMGDNPSAPEWVGESLLGDDLPVQNVTWLQAVELCNRLSALEGLGPAYTITGSEVTWDRDAEGYRLPTEAEWEYAARAGSALVYGLVGEPTEVCRVGNVLDQSFKTRFGTDLESFDCTDGYAVLAPVGRFAPNRWGLYDMVGNVWEWTWDRYAADITSLGVDGGGPSGGVPRVDRGGSFDAHPGYVRVADRVGDDPSDRFGNLGLRLARSLPSAL
jgi:formylglycine-generating enzyme required for sulfatase activity